LLFRSKI